MFGLTMCVAEATSLRGSSSAFGRGVRFRSGARALGCLALCITISGLSFSCRSPTTGAEEAKVGSAVSPQTAAPVAPQGSLPDRDPALARELVGQGALLLDVRSDEEWQAGHLPGARHVPIGELESRLSEIDAMTSGNKNHGIVTYCRSGGRAGRAKSLLQKAGFRRVTNLGGMKDWPQGDAGD